MYTSYILLFFAIVILFSSFVTVSQGTIAVITVFGKYRRLLTPGLNFKIPLIEVVHSRISIQNRSVELEFQAVTIDQANVYFKSMVLYSVNNPDEETIKNVFGAEKFNYLALMMYDPEVHFHVIPRYSKPVYFCDKEFIDPDWPNATKRIAMDLDSDMLQAIKNRILLSASS